MPRGMDCYSKNVHLFFFLYFLDNWTTTASQEAGDFAPRLSEIHSVRWKQGAVQL